MFTRCLGLHCVFIYSLFINQIIWHVIHDVHMCVQAYRPMHEEGGQRKISGVQLYHWAPYSLDAHKPGSQPGDQRVPENAHSPIPTYYSTVAIVP